MGKILFESLFNGNSIEQTTGLNSSTGSSATMEAGSSILLHETVKLFLN